MQDKIPSKTLAENNLKLIQTTEDEHLVEETPYRSRTATNMRRIIPHNSAQSQLNLRPHNSPHDGTKLTSDVAYF